MTSFEVLIQCENDLMPTIGNPGDAGYDLRSSENAVVPARSRQTINTGVSIALPAGYVALVHPRSGLAAKHGITVLNAPGTVDAGYRGQMLVTLVNHSDEDFHISRGDRIAQMLFQKFESARFVVVSELPGSQRGNAGFGSTGVK
ncbi:MAG: dUTP diphosphatase [Actinomycetota bacterium]|jgi:dUTP pyrophosphatase